MELFVFQVNSYLTPFVRPDHLSAIKTNVRPLFLSKSSVINNHYPVVSFRLRFFSLFRGYQPSRPPDRVKCELGSCPDRLSSLEQQHLFCLYKFSSLKHVKIDSRRHTRRIPTDLVNSCGHSATEKERYFLSVEIIDYQ